MSERQLYDAAGQRKYLSENEHNAFLRATQKRTQPDKIHLWPWHRATA